MADSPDRAVFRDNLHRLASNWDLDFDKIAKLLKWKGSDRRWLKRIWDEGLDRPDKRSEDKLAILARWLGVIPQDFWVKDCVRRHHLMHSPYRHRYLAGNEVERTEWFQIMTKLAAILRWLPFLEVHHSEDMNEALSLHRYSHQDLLATWVLHYVGNITIDPCEKRLLEVIEVQQKHRMESLLDEIWRHPRWGKYDNGEVNQLLSLPLSLDEAHARLEKKFGEEDFGKIIDELKQHGHWDHHLKQLFDDDESKCVRTIWGSGISLGDEMSIRVERVDVYPPRIEFARVR